MKTLTFCKISVITEDIYLKLRVDSSCLLSKGESIPVGEVIQFFYKVMPLFYLEFSKCSYSQVLAPACGALVSLADCILNMLLPCEVLTDSDTQVFTAVYYLRI